MKLSIGEGEENLDDVFIILPADQQTLIIVIYLGIWDFYIFVHYTTYYSDVSIPYKMWNNLPSNEKRQN